MRQSIPQGGLFSARLESVRSIFPRWRRGAWGPEWFHDLGACGEASRAIGGGFTRCVLPAKFGRGRRRLGWAASGSDVPIKNFFSGLVRLFRGR